MTTLDRSAALWALQATGREWIAGEGANLGEPLFTVTADLRYEGEAFDTDVPALIKSSVVDVAGLCEAFYQAHKRKYGFRDLESAIEIVTLRLRVMANMLAVPTATKVGETPLQTHETRKVFLGGECHDVAVYKRRLLAAGQTVTGPLVMEQEDTTSWILPGWAVSVEPNGTLIARLT